MRLQQALEPRQEHPDHSSRQWGDLEGLLPSKCEAIEQTTSHDLLQMTVRGGHSLSTGWHDETLGWKEGADLSRGFVARTAHSPERPADSSDAYPVIWRRDRATATFNVENLFARARALRATSVGEANPVLSAFKRFNTVSSKFLYESADKTTMLDDLETLEILVRTASGNRRLNPQPFSAWALLRENRGDFINQPRSGEVEIVAEGRNGWIGWVELITEPVDELGVHMTARSSNT